MYLHVLTEPTDEFSTALQVIGQVGFSIEMQIENYRLVLENAIYAQKMNWCLPCSGS